MWYMLKAGVNTFASFLVVLAAGFILAVILAKFSPEDRQFWVLGGIYTSVFFLVFGLSALAGLGFRTILWGGGGRREHVRSANRQAVLFGIMAVVILMLQAGRLFNPWSAGLLFLIFVLLELYVQ